MKSERIYIAIGAVDEELLHRCDMTQKKPIHFRRWGTLAACLCLMIIGSVVFCHVYRAGQNFPSTGMVISSYDHDETGVSSDGLYAIPENGMWFYTTEVRKALEEYAGSEYADQEIVYFLQIGISKDGRDELTFDCVEMKAELERLTGLGYNVGYAKAWTYQGEGERVDYDYVAGYFTADELETFSVCEDYGYFFSFAKNGNGSPIEAGQGIITKPNEAESEVHSP